MGLFLFVLSTKTPFTMKQIINTPNAPMPIGPYNQAVSLNGMLYVSGQIAIDPATGQLVLDNIEAETHRVLQNLQANHMDEDFVGVKVGDVNASVIANSLQTAEERTASTMLFDVEDRAVKAGETFTVNFKGTERVQGYQFTMNFNGLEVMDIAGNGDIKAENFGVFQDALTTSVDGSDNEFAVTFRATKAGQLSSMLGVSSRITKAEAYSLSNNRMDVAFRFNGQNGATISGVGFELYQNQPNPFVNKTFIGFHLPEAADATLRIFDETGRMVFTQSGSFAKGYNTISVDRQLLNTTGVLYYTLETATDKATKKMIQSK